MKQSELAEKMEKTNTDMSFIENKRLYPDIQGAEKLASELGVTIGQIYSEAELNLIMSKGR